MKRVTRVVFAGVVALALLAALFGASAVSNVALAQGPVTTPTAPANPPPAPPTNALEQTFWQSLANRLGVTIDRLTQAVKDAAKDTIASALQGGSLTQQQADALNQRADQWQPGQGIPLGGKGGRGHGGDGERGGLGGPGGLDAAAKALNMTSSELMTELQSGKTLADVAQAKGVSQDAVKQAMVAAKKAEIDAAVTAGRLTADQATQMKSQIDQQAAGLDLNSLLRGHGFEGDPRPFGPGRAPNQAPQAPTTPPSGSGA